MFETLRIGCACSKRLFARSAALIASARLRNALRAEAKPAIAAGWRSPACPPRLRLALLPRPPIFDRGRLELLRSAHQVDTEPSRVRAHRALAREAPQPVATGLKGSATRHALTAWRFPGHLRKSSSVLAQPSSVALQPRSRKRLARVFTTRRRAVGDCKRSLGCAWLIKG